MEPANRGRCRDVVDHEAGVGRGVEVRGEQVDVALGTLRTFEEACSDPDAFEEHGGPVKRRPGMDERRSQRFDDAARRPCRMQAELIGHAAPVRTGRIGNL